MSKWIFYLYSFGHNIIFFRNNNFLKNLSRNICLELTVSRILSIKDWIPSKLPIPGSNYKNSSAWLKEYKFSCPQYRQSIFNKGPLHCLKPINQYNTKPGCLSSRKSYKISVKSLFLSLQSHWRSKIGLIFFFTGD